ncbi:uncharacterized protein NPIL_498011 [Nephila pilipes]|uniref:Nudix hydrolase domain-containing protein n=1 Tax=Nephila pilipes TaxID=299642 RepID=A0A8X6P3Z2_NEPPI|nr:uncharacterized protein NPIL_498011 [Nephila pilipes]
MANHKCSTSYGIVVKTACKRIVVLRRKVPYCIHDFFHCMHKKKCQIPSQFSEMQYQFEDEWLAHLKDHELVDYKRYVDGEIFEDLYDFPHGQLGRSNKQKGDISNISLFYAAYREFQEETGFHFTFTQTNIEQYPLVFLHYKSLDGSLYKHIYFIVNNVKGLKRHTYFNSFSKSSTPQGQITNWTDDYQGLMIPIEVAYKIFFRQQSIKSDMKHLLCSNYLERLHRLTLSERECTDEQDADNKESDCKSKNHES